MNSAACEGVVVVDTSQRVSGPPNLGPERLAFRDAHPWEATCAEL